MPRRRRQAEDGPPAKEAVKADNVKAIIRDAAREIIGLLEEKATIQAAITEARGRVKGHIKMADFNVALRMYELEGDDRAASLDGLRLAFEALEIGGQGSLFPEAAPPAGSNGNGLSGEARLQAANQEGVAAGLAGKNRDTNPYRDEDGRHDYWDRGWHGGQRQLLADIGKGPKKAEEPRPAA